MDDLKVGEPVHDRADHGAEHGDGGGLDDAVDGREEQRARPDVDHVQPHGELPHPASHERANMSQLSNCAALFNSLPSHVRSS